MEKLHKERIERYLDGNMSDEEKTIFEQDLQSDTALSDAFERYLRNQNILLEDETSSPDPALLRDAMPRESGHTESDIEASDAVPMDIKHELTGRPEGKEITSQPEEPKRIIRDLSRYLRPISLVLLLISFYFFIKNSCNDSPRVSDALTQEGDMSPAIQDAVSTDEASILEDMKSRPEENYPMEDELVADTSSTNSFAPPPPTEEETEDCAKRIEQADAFYKKENYEAAQIPLVMIVQDENSACEADAWFYLGLIRLKLGDPEGCLQCLAKVDNLEKYGTDMQWYMALAFYEMAENDSEARARSIRAFEHQLDIQSSEERKAKARALIKELQ